MSEPGAAEKDSWLIGRGDDCDLTLNDAAVSWHHCLLKRHGDGFTLEDLKSRNGTFVDGVKMAPNSPAAVAWGMRITLGEQAEMPWPNVPREPRKAVAASDSPSGALRRTITIGRNPASDVHIDLPAVSWNHASITYEDGKYVIEDNNSRNGTAIGELSHRIQRSVLRPESDVFLGSYKVPAKQLISRERKFEVGDAARGTIVFSKDKNEVVIGRDPSSDVPRNFPMISWRHAKLTRAPGGIVVEDLNSRNGTFVDGVRVHGKVLIKPGQEIGLGSFRFQLNADGALLQREYYGNVTIEAKEIVVHAQNRRLCLLNPVSLTIFPSELVAVMGPAGAGKTTLLKALNGYTKPTAGTVLFNGADLYRYYDRFRQQMGYVPQDDILHAQLTVREAMRFSAKLRTDLTDSEIETRIEEIAADLKLTDRLNKQIGSPEKKVLSGGQRKRVNIAIELITDTPVLFLDEPTSGLSSYDADSVIELLKGLARSGKTIVTTIHQPSLKVYKQFDDLIMVSRDRQMSDTQLAEPAAMVYFGPAYPDAVQFFNPRPTDRTVVQPQPEASPEMLEPGMNAVPEQGRTETWRQRYAASRYQNEFVAERAGKVPSDSGQSGEEKPRRQFGFKQWVALVERNVIVKLRDRTQTAILMLQAPFFAALVCVIATPLDKDQSLPEKLLIAHFLLVVAAIWFGCNNAARDIVGEWTIYRRERMVTLKIAPYVFSKLAVLFALCIFQCGLMLIIVYFFLGLKSDLLREFAILLVSSLIGAGLGLIISAFAKTTESAIALLPVALLPMIALAGAMRPVYVMPWVGRIASDAIPSRWALEANFLNEAGKDWLEPPPTAPVGPPAPTPPAPDIARNCPIDIAQHNFPTCVVRFEDDQGVHLRLPTDREYRGEAPAPATETFRHSYRDSLAVLGAMFVFCVFAVMICLLRRDHDPQ